MKRAFIAAFALLLFAALPRAQDVRIDGVNDVLVVVNGKSITYQEIVGDTDMQAEINAWRAFSPSNQAPPADAEIENLLVMQKIGSFVLQRLLDSEAAKVKMQITDSQMRTVLNRERSGVGITEDDTKGWARYLKDRYNLSPSEYRQRRRQEIVRNEVMNFMSGAYGPLPPQYPLEVYFALSVTPRDVRLEFEKEGDRYRYAYDIDYREFKLRYPADTTSFKEATKLGEGVREVMNKVKKNESLEAARVSLDKLIDDLGVAGAKVEITERRVAADDTDLDPLAYDMVMTLPPTGGVSDESALQETDDDGTNYRGARFVQLFKCRFGTLKAFEDPKVQEAIRDRLFSARMQENRLKVEQELLRRAAIVPEHWFKR